MIIFAHRGMKNEMPENTIPAFRRAFSCGFGIEFDVRMTIDKKVVIIHDKDLSRIIGKKVNISDMTLLELRKLDFGAYFASGFTETKIPTLEEVCELIVKELPYGQKVAIHLKYDEQTEEMLKSVSTAFKNFDLYQKAFVFDLTIENAKKIRKINDKIPIALSVADDNYGPTVYFWKEVAESINSFDYVWLDEWKSQGSVLNKALVDKINNAGKKIYVISPELHREHGHPQSETGYENVWRDLNKWGINGICTAYPDKLKMTLASESLLIDEE